MTSYIRSLLSSKKGLEVWLRNNLLVSLYNWYTLPETPDSDPNYVAIKIAVKFDALLKYLARKVAEIYNIELKDIVDFLKEKSSKFNDSDLALFNKLIGVK